MLICVIMIHAAPQVRNLHCGLVAFKCFIQFILLHKKLDSSCQYGDKAGHRSVQRTYLVLMVFSGICSDGCHVDEAFTGDFLVDIVSADLWLCL